MWGYSSGPRLGNNCCTLCTEVRNGWEGQGGGWLKEDKEMRGKREGVKVGRSGKGENGKERKEEK